VFSLCSYANVGIGTDPEYAYKEKTDKYDAALDAHKVRQTTKIV
jgi:hypothetical protein